jgi:hypothetical protein
VGRARTGRARGAAPARARSRAQTGRVETRQPKNRSTRRAARMRNRIITAVGAVALVLAVIARVWRAIQSECNTGTNEPDVPRPMPLPRAEAQIRHTAAVAEANFTRRGATPRSRSIIPATGGAQS